MILHTIFGDISCEYGTVETDLGALTGGNPATLDIAAVIPFIGGRAMWWTSKLDRETGHDKRPVRRSIVRCGNESGGRRNRFGGAPAGSS
jgi:hypothetical protein